MIPALDAGSMTWVGVGVRVSTLLVRVDTGARRGVDDLGKVRVRVRPSTLLVRVDAGARRGVDHLVRVRGKVGVRVRATVVCCQRDLVGVRVSVR